MVIRPITWSHSHGRQRSGAIRERLSFSHKKHGTAMGKLKKSYADRIGVEVSALR
ncbi:hypothetical protein KIN20_035584 [Parelaphostrongylus tenuis]|uniref:Uncharacterized protein n=1 Tax=Parelaphostrongylus tenuis TaxID=148309 RepID=A0AAD5RBM6_PARTN|nr:hypothetical protein KIN20_035584 [Parelaphostrongylus tenuis]